MALANAPRLSFLAAAALLAGAAGAGLALYRAGPDPSATPSRIAEASVPKGATLTILQIEGKGEMKGMVCGGCARRVSDALREVPGVLQVEVDPALVERLRIANNRINHLEINKIDKKLM